MGEGDSDVEEEEEEEEQQQQQQRGAARRGNDKLARSDKQAGAQKRARGGARAGSDGSEDEEGGAKRSRSQSMCEGSEGAGCTQGPGAGPPSSGAKSERSWGSAGESEEQVRNVVVWMRVPGGGGLCARAGAKAKAKHQAWMVCTWCGCGCVFVYVRMGGCSWEDSRMTAMLAVMVLPAKHGWGAGDACRPACHRACQVP